MRCGILIYYLSGNGIAIILLYKVHISRFKLYLQYVSLVNPEPYIYVYKYIG